MKQTLLDGARKVYIACSLGQIGEPHAQCAGLKAGFIFGGTFTSPFSLSASPDDDSLLCVRLNVRIVTLLLCLYLERALLEVVENVCFS